MPAPVVLLVRVTEPDPPTVLEQRLKLDHSDWTQWGPENTGNLDDTRSYSTTRTPAGCSWSGGTAGAGDLVVGTSGVEVTGIEVLNGRIRGSSGVANVWVHDNIVHGGPTPGGSNTQPYALVQASSNGGTGWVIEDNTLIWDKAKRTVDCYGIHAPGAAIRRNHIAGAVDGIVMYGNGSVTEANYIEELAHYDVDPRQSNGPSHDDGIQDEGGDAHTIRGNQIRGTGANHRALILTQNTARLSNLTVVGNLFRGGNPLAVNGSEKSKGAFLNFVYAFNVHGRESSEGQRGAGVAIFPSATYDSMTRDGNTYDDGTPMAVRRDNSQ